MNGNHGGVIALQYGNIVQRPGTDAQRLAVGNPLDDGMMLHVVVAHIQGVDGLFHLVGSHICEEAQPPHVDAHNRYALVAHIVSRLQEGAVAAHGDNEIGLEVAAFEDARDGNLQMAAGGEEIVILSFHLHNGSFFLQECKNPLYAC